jgi:hypothetical protein
LELKTERRWRENHYLSVNKHEFEKYAIVV